MGSDVGNVGSGWGSGVAVALGGVGEAGSAVGSGLGVGGTAVGVGVGDAGVGVRVAVGVAGLACLVGRAVGRGTSTICMAGGFGVGSGVCDGVGAGLYLVTAVGDGDSPPSVHETAANTETARTSISVPAPGGGALQCEDRTIQRRSVGSAHSSVNVPKTVDKTNFWFGRRSSGPSY